MSFSFSQCQMCRLTCWQTVKVWKSNICQDKQKWRNTRSIQKPLKLKFSQPYFSKTQKDPSTLLIYTLSLYKKIITWNVSNDLKNLWCIFPSLRLFDGSSGILNLLIEVHTWKKNTFQCSLPGTGTLLHGKGGFLFG